MKPSVIRVIVLSSLLSAFGPSAYTQPSSFPRGSSVKTAEAVLTGASIVFNTADGGNDKDDDTKLLIEVSTPFAGGFQRKIATKGWETFGRFADGSVHTVALDVVGNGIPLDKMNAIHLRIGFEPNGDDTWKFSYQLNLTFSDGTVLTKNGDGRELSDGKRLLDEG